VYTSDFEVKNKIHVLNFEIKNKACKDKSNIKGKGDCPHP
jgi:hypothetical protein